MTPRERFQRVMHHEPIDRIPMFYPYETVTQQAERLWVQQGLPLGMDPYTYIGFDSSELIPLNTEPLPNFVPTTIESDEEWVTHIDPWGFTVRTSKQNRLTPTIYYYLKGSVETREDWEQMKARYDPRDIRRYGSAWSPELLEHYRTAEHPVGIMMHWGPGRGPKNGYMLGLEAFLDKLTGDRAFVHEMFEFWMHFTIDLLTPVVTQTKVDYVWFNEDGLAYKNSTLISPEMYREFWSAYLGKVIEFLRASGVDLVGFYTSGNIQPLIPTFLDTGFNMFGPQEVAADMDPVKLRRQYGKNLLQMGGFSRQSLMDGRAAIDREFQDKIPWLMEQGGTIPMVDDMILPDISFDSYVYYHNKIRDYRW